MQGLNRKSLSLLLMLTLSTFFISACAPKFTPRAASVSNPISKTHLSDQDVLDIDPTREVTEEDIQEAIRMAGRDSFKLMPKSRIILVQSGSAVPDTTMQEAMVKHYQVSIYSGIAPNKQRLVRQRDQASATGPGPSYIKTLRLAAAKARQSKIVVYWGFLELGKPDALNKTITWVPYHGGEIPSSIQSIRYLIRFAIVDVKSGEWVMYSPPNYEQELIKTSGYMYHENQMNQIEKLKRETYKLSVEDLSQRFVN